jgi:hypothetical protein
LQFLFEAKYDFFVNSFIGYFVCLNKITASIKQITNGTNKLINYFVVMEFSSKLIEKQSMKCLSCQELVREQRIGIAFIKTTQGTKLVLSQALVATGRY